MAGQADGQEIVHREIVDLPWPCDPWDPRHGCRSLSLGRSPTESSPGVGAALGFSGRTQDGVVDAGQASFFSTNFGHAVNQGAGIRVLGVL